MFGSSDSSEVERGRCGEVEDEFFLLFGINILFTRVINNKLKSSLGIGITHASALLYIKKSEDASFRGLARLFDCSLSRISRLVDELEERGFITASPGVEDKRVVKIKMTPDGDVISRSIRDTLFQAGETIADSLSDFERRGLVRLAVKMGGELDS